MKDPIDDIADITHLPPSIVGLVTRVVADKDSEIERLRAALKGSAAQIEKLAFSMPPPNAYTPQFVMIAQNMARVLNEQEGLSHSRP